MKPAILCIAVGLAAFAFGALLGADAAKPALAQVVVTSWRPAGGVEWGANGIQAFFHDPPSARVTVCQLNRTAPNQAIVCLPPVRLP